MTTIEPIFSNNLKLGRNAIYGFLLHIHAENNTSARAYKFWSKTYSWQKIKTDTKTEKTSDNGIFMCCVIFYIAYAIFKIANTIFSIQNYDFKVPEV